MDRITKRPQNSEVQVFKCFVLETEQGDAASRALSLLDRTVLGGKCKNIGNDQRIVSQAYGQGIDKYIIRKRILFSLAQHFITD